MNTNLVHNILNLIGLIVGALLTVDWTVFGMWQSEDQQQAQMQKQIDELKQGQSNTYGARDLLLDMRERQDRLERQLYATRQ